MPTSAAPAKNRVLHVPLTDAEWQALRRLALESEVTLGTLTATALHRAYPLTPRRRPTVTVDSYAESLRLVIADCETAAAALDGQPFNGRTVAESLGHILAMIQAVARAVEALHNLPLAPKEQSE